MTALEQLRRLHRRCMPSCLCCRALADVDAMATLPVCYCTVVPCWHLSIVFESESQTNTEPKP